MPNDMDRSMNKKLGLLSILVLIVGLLHSPALLSQNTTISFGVPEVVLTTTDTGAVLGNSFAAPGGQAYNVAWSTAFEGAPGAVSVSIQGSVDGTSWTTFSSSTNASGTSVNAGANGWRFLRAIQNSRTGGTLTTITLYLLRLYPIASTSGSSPVITGPLLFSPDNTYDIGISSSNRPRFLWLASSLTVGNSAAMIFQSRSMLWSPTDGNILLQNNANNDFDRLQLGGTTSTFPALRRNGDIINVVRADNSAYTGIQIGSLLYGSSTAFASLPASVNGTMLYCADCTFANPCAGGGTGAFAKRLNGAWRCD